MQVIKDLKQQGTPLVVDADGLYIVTKDLDLVRGYGECILTPNKNEFQRLADQLGLDLAKEGEEVRLCDIVSAHMGRPEVCQLACMCRRLHGERVKAAHADQRGLDTAKDAD